MGNALILRQARSQTQPPPAMPISARTQIPTDILAQVQFQILFNRSPVALQPQNGIVTDSMVEVLPLAHP